jgi:hypothetical protein
MPAGPGAQHVLSDYQRGRRSALRAVSAASPKLRPLRGGRSLGTGSSAGLPPSRYCTTIRAPLRLKDPAHVSHRHRL